MTLPTLLQGLSGLAAAAAAPYRVADSMRDMVYLTTGAKEVVMLDREPVALQCSLLSAQACGLQSVQDYTQHGQSEATPGHQHQQPSDWKGASVLPEGSNSHAAQSAKAGLLQVVYTSLASSWPLHASKRNADGCICKISAFLGKFKHVTLIHLNLCQPSLFSMAYSC